MLRLHDRDLVTLNGRKGWVGTVAGGACRDAEDPFKAVARAKKFGHDLYWINQEAAMLCGDPGYYEEEKKRWARAIALNEGQLVQVEGKVLRVHYIGNYSNMGKLIETNIKAEYAEAEEIADAEAEAEDGANRIAAAAPQLLNALESLINDAGFDPVHKTWTIGPFSDDPKGRIAYSQAAIAKARKGAK